MINIVVKSQDSSHNGLMSKKNHNGLINPINWTFVMCLIPTDLEGIS